MDGTVFMNMINLHAPRHNFRRRRRSSDIPTVSHTVAMDTASTDL